MSQQNPSLIYLEQTLTPDQKAQVLTNIGAQAAETGKGLVPNTDIEKLASIAADAEENTIETISIGGEALPVDEYKNVNIPLATAPAGSSDGNSGAVTASDKYKLDHLTNKTLHRIFFDEDSVQPGDKYGALQDMEGTFDTTNHCYPQVLADDFYDWLVEGQYIVLIIGSLGTLSSPPTPEDYYYGNFLHPNFIDYGIDQHDEKWVEIGFHQVDGSTPSIKWTFVDTTSEETPNYARISLNEDLSPYEPFPLQYDLSAPLTSGDAGKVLRAGWNSGSPSFGYVDWDDAREVPTVGSADNGKVLKATYNSSTGEGSYAWDSASGEANVIEGVKLAGAASVLTPDAAKNVTIPNAVATGETGATNGLMTAADKKTVSESVIYKANPTTGAEHLLAQRLYIVRSDQEIINIITGGGAEGQGTILFRIG